MDAIYLLSTEERTKRDFIEACLLEMKVAGRTDYDIGYKGDSFGCKNEFTDKDEEFCHCPDCNLNFGLICNDSRNRVHSDVTRETCCTEQLVPIIPGVIKLKY